jgi:hypothetical protein
MVVGMRATCHRGAMDDAQTARKDDARSREE